MVAFSSVPSGNAMTSALSFFLFSILSTAPALAYSRAECQAPTADPLAGCVPGTLLVSPNSTVTTRNSTSFTSIQSAILSLGNTTTPATILILPGTYVEQVNITRPGPVTLLGQTSSPNNASKNSVTLLWRQATGNSVNTFDNAYTSALTVAPTLESSLTGSGPTGHAVPADTPFGNADFRAYNVDFVNDYAPYSAGPALAISISYANTGFYFCGFYSYQDTVRPPSPFPHQPLLIPTDLRRQARQRLHPRLHHRRPDRLPLRLRHDVDPVVPPRPALLRRRHHRVEGHQHVLPQRVRRLHPRQRRREGERLALDRGAVRARAPVERAAPLDLRGYVP